MSFVRRFFVIYRTDIKLLRRDPMLVYSVVITLVFLGVVRYFQERLGELYPIVALLVLIFIPLIFGMIPGFMMANEKEEKTIQALQVIPISSEAFLTYRLLWASAITVILTVLAPKILDINVPWKGLLALIALFIIEVPIYALLIIDFSETRMQALTVSKIAGWLLILPAAIKFIVVARHLSTDWSKFTAFLPTYWVYKIFEWIAFNDYSDFPIALGVHLAWLFLLVLLFKRKIL
ncbi:ABC transporter permease [Thermococcus sp. M39]|uniref:ABC transporter permease n=1 Tax=unclassified Thermococcus TaxID=2627626 RepID=UPI00143C2172|nr:MULTISPECIES: ABC transporter permease [unclassified Thermococcus]NJE07452.1 ABC transporter permease [Thermococcus sp. M39]NJE12416.1 ABC transporter permease [Thermococcus sp. LS2]